MPYGHAIGNRYEVVSDREGDHHVWNYTVFPEEATNWGEDTASMGMILSCFGEQVRDLLMERYTSLFDELIDEEGELPDDQVLTMDDAKHLAEQASTEGPGAIARLRDTGKRTRLSYEEALAEYEPLIGTVHHGCYLR